MALRRLLSSTTFGRLILGRDISIASKFKPGSRLGVRLESTAEVPDPSPKLFVSGLSKRTTDDGLRAAFEKFGRVLEARVVTDRMSGVSKGFAFVRYATQEEADKGKEGMDGKFLDGWVIFADYAKPRPPRTFDNSQGPNQSFGAVPRSYENSQGPNQSFGGAPRSYENSQGSYDNFQGSNSSYGGTSSNYGTNSSLGGASSNYDNFEDSNSSYDRVSTYDGAQKY